MKDAGRNEKPSSAQDGEQALGLLSLAQWLGRHTPLSGVSSVPGEEANQKLHRAGKKNPYVTTKKVGIEMVTNLVLATKSFDPSKLKTYFFLQFGIKAGYLANINQDQPMN